MFVASPPYGCHEIQIRQCTLSSVNIPDLEGFGEKILGFSGLKMRVSKGKTIFWTVFKEAGLTSSISLKKNFFFRVFKFL